MNTELIKKIQQCPNLPSLPTIAVQVLELAGKPDVDIAEIARQSQKILRCPEKSFAPSIAVFTAAASTSAPSARRCNPRPAIRQNPGSGLLAGHHAQQKQSQRFQSSEILATQHLRRHRRPHTGDENEACPGGRGIPRRPAPGHRNAVLNQVISAEYGEISGKANTHAELIKAEQEALGLTHAEVSAFLAEQWKLPPILATTVGASHDPSKVADPVLRKIAQVVQIASQAADVFVDAEPAEAIVQVRAPCAAATR